MSSAPVNLLNSVASITEQRQLKALASSLIETINRTMGLSDIAIINVCELPHFPKMMASNDFIDTHTSFFPFLKDCIEKGEVILCDQTPPVSVLLPIKMNNVVVKVLLVHDITPDEALLTMLMAFSRIYENFSKVVHESQTDGLTGLFNRKAYENRLFYLFNCVQSDNRTEPHFWIMTFDIDFFKRINDTLGHLYGDEVLIRISNIMRSCFQCDDALFRFGGDEFVVLLDDKSRLEVEVLCGQLLHLCKDIYHQKIGAVTLSIGISALSNEDDPPSIMLKADQALYFVKQNGRNGWAFYGDLLANGNAAQPQIVDDIELF